MIELTDEERERLEEEIHEIADEYQRRTLQRLSNEMMEEAGDNLQGATLPPKDMAMRLEKWALELRRIAGVVVVEEPRERGS